MKPKIIGIDIGYGNTKAVWSHGLDKANKEVWGEVCFKSIVPFARFNDEQNSGSFNADRILMDINGRHYYAGPAACIGNAEISLDPDHIETDKHEALLRASLHLMMRETGQIIENIDVMVLGLPVSGFASRNEKLYEIALRPRIVPVPFSLQKNGKPEKVVVKATKALILPQPFGALRYAMQKIREDEKTFSNSALSMVIDPGYKTIDWFVSQGMVAEMQLSGSFDGGVASIFRKVSQQIGVDYGTGSLDFDQIEQGLKNGIINLGCQVIDTTPYLSTVVSAAKQEVSKFLTRIDPGKTGLSRVFLTGGGAEFYAEAFKEKLPGYQIEMLKNSVMVNARGYWMLGCDIF